MAKTFKNEKKTGNYPKAPDLFIVDKKGVFLFLEVKLPGDKIDLQQETGLELIRKHLKTKNDAPIVVKKLDLIPLPDSF